MADTKELIRQEAKVVLKQGIGQVVRAAKSGLDLAKELRAQAEPVLAAVDGIQKDIDRVNAIVQDIDDALAQLERFGSVPEVAPLRTIMLSIKPVAEAMIVLQTARKVLALTAIPDIGALAASGLVLVAQSYEQGISKAVNDLTKLIDES